MTLSDERIQELKNLMEEKSGKEVSWEEAAEAGRNLASFAELMFELWVKEQRREKKLKESPNGFVLEGVGYSCFICGIGTREGENWYDKWGIKCSVCQAAINRKEIPASLAKHKESWYSKWELERSFNLKGAVLNSWIKTGILKARIVKNEQGRTHTQLFLIKDNKDFLPPKKLVKSQLVREEREGQIWHRSEPWYKFVDPRVYLKDYKIVEFLSVTEDLEETKGK